MGWGTAIGVIVAGNLLYVGLRVWLGHGIRPGMFGQVSDLATKRLTAELTRLDLPDHAATALGRIEGPALARQIHRNLMGTATIDEAYIEEFTTALSARLPRSAASCARMFETDSERAARYEEIFRAYRLWFVKFVEGATEADPQSGIRPDGSGLCDDLDADILFDAFDAGFDPLQFGRQFADEIGLPDEDIPGENISADHRDAVLRRLVADLSAADRRRA